MARLRSPTGCPWDRQQSHLTLRRHAIEEVYELIDAIEAGDDHEMAEELGDLLMQVVFHCQLARERGAFDFDEVCRRLVNKLIRRHPHVFGQTRVKSVDEVWANWEKIKRAEKHGTRHARHSALDGIPKHLPALLRAEKLVKKARKAKLLAGGGVRRVDRHIIDEQQRMLGFQAVENLPQRADRAGHLCAYRDLRRTACVLALDDLRRDQFAAGGLDHGLQMALQLGAGKRRVGCD